MATRIYTRRGDRGDTGLFKGPRVLKSHPRVDAYGDVDELNAVIGLARAQGLPSDLDALLASVQGLLLELGAELATLPAVTERPSLLSEEDVTRMERAIDDAEAELQPLTSFILPAGAPAAAALHLARTVCRRAERACVALRELEPDTSLMPVTLLNRLGDLLFVLARLANHRAGRADVPWHSRK